MSVQVRAEALLIAASEELRGGLMRLKEATDEAAEADVLVEDQDQRVPWRRKELVAEKNTILGCWLGFV